MPGPLRSGSGLAGEPELPPLRRRPASQGATRSTELIAVAAAGIILFVAFGSLLGMLVPLLVAVAGLGAGLLTVGLFSHVTTLGSIALHSARPRGDAYARAGELVASAGGSAAARR
ncbi:MMPL family transporter [Streptomyces griseochromogenes]|uniref:MMPL family transporter n=1 Tax=Streptomyces griseochromogenes TaxID=68214 RepID=UPI0037A07AF9